jgi:hypothetical protein
VIVGGETPAVSREDVRVWAECGERQQEERFADAPGERVTGSHGVCGEMHLSTAAG